MSKETIEAMKLAKEFIESVYSDSAVLECLREAINREEAQSVEPFCWAEYNAELKLLERGGIMVSETRVDFADIPLFTHPAPAKQPLSAERKALLSQKPKIPCGTTAVYPETMGLWAVWVDKAADMLAAEPVKLGE